MKKKRRLTTTHVIMLGFLAGALLGAVLLYLPISQRPGCDLAFVDALFVSVSGICVTGLSTVNIGQTFSGFGQVVLLILIQFGGLGVVTFTTLLLIAFRKRISLTNRMLIQSAYNIDTLSGLWKLTLRIVKVTLMIEMTGAVLYAFVFIPEYGVKGIWYAMFHAVSAFCNAGIDLLGGNSFCAYRENVLLNVTTMYLILVSGLGFPVYWEILRVVRIRRKTKNAHAGRMQFHAKLVLILTFGLFLGGTILTLLLEYDNPATLGNIHGMRKVMAAAFQSTTLRTAGFATIDQGGFRTGSCLVYLLFMFIGGSPAGTAGGVKTVTVMILIASMFANIRGKKDVSIMGHRIADDFVKRCVAIILFSFSTLFVLSVLLLAVQDYNFLDAMYEMTSAIATVGLSRGMTGNLHTSGKLIVSLAMYLGRIGPITLALAFNTRKANASLSYANTKVIIG